MTKFLAYAGALLVSFVGSAVAHADVSVTNKTIGTIHVQIGTGSKTEVKNNEKAVFNNNAAGELEVSVYANGTKKASAKVKNNSKVIVENRNGVWSIKTE
jgi:hypothetical protein